MKQIHLINKIITKKMKKRFVITNVPIGLPFQSTILYTFLLHHFQVSGIWWGIFITIYSFYWIIAIVAKWNECQIDLTSDLTSSDLSNDKKALIKTFAKRLNQVINGK